jgi:hypothetical protein
MMDTAKHTTTIMDPEKQSNLTLPPSMHEKSASGVTTPDLIADEKERRQSYELSLEGNGATAIDEAPIEVFASGKTLIPVVAALVCSVFLVALDMTIIGTAIPKITDDFDGLNMVSWYGSV